jgi:hypothetical protein
LFFSLYLMTSLNAPEGFGRVFVALSLCYGVAFVAVVAEWFWGRWFASGLAWSGIMIAVAALVVVGWIPALVIFGALHLVVVVCLMGKKMAARYDLQEGWRQKYKMDDFGVARLQKTVTRSAASLPSLILWALAPKEEGMAALAVGATLLAVAGLRGVIHLRSWGILALAGAAAAAVFGSSWAGLSASSDMGPLSQVGGMAGAPLAMVFLAAAVLPFTGSILRYLRRSAP